MSRRLGLFVALCLRLNSHKDSVRALLRLPVARPKYTLTFGIGSTIDAVRTIARIDTIVPDSGRA